MFCVFSKNKSTTSFKVFKELIKILEKGEKPKRYTLGISVYEVSTILNKEDYSEGTIPDVTLPDGVEYGLYVNEVDANGKAFGRLQFGDIILEVNQVKIFGSKEFRAELGKVIDADSLVLLINRSGVEIEVLIKL